MRLTQVLPLRTPLAGLTLRNIQLPVSLLDLTSDLVTIPMVTVRRVQLVWPTARNPLIIRVEGVRLRVLQRRTALKVGCGPS
jgi:hypothetical protein